MKGCRRRMSKLLTCIALVSMTACAADEHADRVEERPDFTASKPDMGLRALDSGTRQQQGEQLRLTFRPNRPVYQVGDTIRVTAFRLDDPNEQMPISEVSYSLQPSSIAQFDDARRFTIINDGTGRVIGCTVDNLCGSKPFRVQSKPVVVFEPELYATLQGGDGLDTITVAGRVLNTVGQARLSIGDEPVAVDEDGRFEHSIRPIFGVNQLAVAVADDVNVVPTVSTEGFIWAPRIITVDNNGVTLGASVHARLDQATLDAGESGYRVDGNQFEANSLAGLGELIFRNARLQDLLSAVPSVELPGLNIEVTNITFGDVELELELTDSGAELLARLEQVELVTAGQFELDTERVSLDGSLTASVATFADFRVSYIDQLNVSIPTYDISTSQLAGMYPDNRLNALIGGLDTQIGMVARGLLRDLAGDIVSRTIPSIFELGFGLIETEIQQIPIFIDTQVEGIPPVGFNLEITPTDLQSRAALGATLTLNTRLQHPRPVGRPQGAEGIPALASTPYSAEFQNGLAVVIDLSLFNAICHELWRAGIFEAKPTLPASAQGLVEDVSFAAKLPPVIVPNVRDNSAAFAIQMVAFELSLRPLGGEGHDTYSILFEVAVRNATTGTIVSLAPQGPPRIDIQLLESYSGQPLDPTVLATLIEAAVWPELESALNYGLSYGIDEIVVDSAELAPIAPTITSLRFGPLLDSGLLFKNGRFVFEGRLTINGALAD